MGEHKLGAKEEVANLRPPRRGGSLGCRGKSAGAEEEKKKKPPAYCAAFLASGKCKLPDNGCLHYPHLDREGYVQALKKANE